MIRRSARLVLSCAAVALEAILPAAAQDAPAPRPLPLDWSSTVAYEWRGGATDWSALPEGSALLVRAWSMPEAHLEALRSQTNASKLHLLVLPSASTAKNLIADVPKAALKPNVNWDALFDSLANAAPRRMLRLRTEALPAETWHRLLLAPGGVLLDRMPLDETARAIAAFRLRHPAVGTGDHQRLVNNVYAFQRSLDRKTSRDDVIVVFGASGETNVNVSRVFADDTLLRDALTKDIAFVSFGMARFEVHESGLILIEEIP